MRCHGQNMFSLREIDQKSEGGDCEFKTLPMHSYRAVIGRYTKRGGESDPGYTLWTFLFPSTLQPLVLSKEYVSRGSNS
jgi:hypothetical protein